MARNLQELPRFADKLSFIYVEHAVVDQHEKAIALHQADGMTPVPAAALGVLMLGPGTKITHAAVKALADNNCQVLWSGEHGVRLYAQGIGGKPRIEPAGRQVGPDRHHREKSAGRPTPPSGQRHGGRRRVG